MGRLIDDLDKAMQVAELMQRSAPQKANGPAEAATSPSPGPNNPNQENVMDTVTNNTLPAAPASSTDWHEIAESYEAALRSAVHLANFSEQQLVAEASRMSGVTGPFALPEDTYYGACAALRGIMAIATAELEVR